AMARIAAYMRARKPEVLAKEMNQKQSGFYFSGALNSVDFYLYPDFCHRLSSSFGALECAVKRPRREATWSTPSPCEWIFQGSIRPRNSWLECVRWWPKPMIIRTCRLSK